jgi:UDP-N-acetylglucosamine 3-dehydrogenase
MAALRTLLIGAGRMGRNHLRVLREDPRFEVVAIVDPRAGEVLGDSPGCPTAPSLAALGDLDCDCAVVAAPTELHIPLARQLLQRRLPFLLEKPLGESAAECRQIVELSENLGVKMAVGHLERFNPAVRKLKSLLDSGWLGKPIHFSFTRVGGYPEGRNVGSNVLLDLAVHDLDVLRFLLAGPMKAVACVCHSAWRHGVFDTAEILLTAGQAQSASIHVNWVTPTKIRTLRVTGTQGVCFVDYILQSCVMLGGNLLRRQMSPLFDFESLLEEYKSTDRVELGVVKREPLKTQLDELYKLLTGSPSEACSPQDALAAVSLAEDAIRMATLSYHRTPDDSVPPPTDPAAGRGAVQQEKE